MELIAASRIVKAQNRLAAARPYADKITDVLRNLQSAGASTDHPLLRAPEQRRKIGYVVVTADRGLAGGYNASVVRVAELAIKDDLAAGRTPVLYVVGKKGAAALTYKNYDIAQKFIGFSDNPRYEHAKAIAGAAVRAFEAGDLDEINLIYTQFVSFGTQRVVQKRFVPLEQTITDGAVTTHADRVIDYEYEPSPSDILTSLIPRYVESRLYAMLLDAAASEHAARQRAMKAATDNADDLAKVLTRAMNRARQEAITTEIMEIVGGAEALVSEEAHDLFGTDSGLVEVERERIQRQHAHDLH
jgi:F-type H+-transporting ATPase subunit gamma